MKKLNIFLFLAFLVITNISFAQYTFDNCQYSKFIDIKEDYCSEPGEYTNVGATADPQFPNGCNTSVRFANGVWFSFIPNQSAASIRVLGKGFGGTIASPNILLFSDCNSFLDCTTGAADKAELVADKLIIGKTYYIMIESAIGGEGSFQLCIEDFTPVPSPQSDCKDGVILCDKSTFIVQQLNSAGDDLLEIEPDNCMYNPENPKNTEKGSSWYKWTCDKSGTLTFTLTPNDFVSSGIETIDLDFSVYELPNGIDDCRGKILKRCMASGANIDANGKVLPLSQWSSCNGKTGLRSSESDRSESPGCLGNSNNFISALNMESGKSYVLIVNNYSNSGLGFKIDFGGTGTFLGPKADFDIKALDKFECDKTIQFTNKSESATDQITNYLWNFGNGANPISSSQEGPLDVIYDSFGDKIVALTIKSSRGCQVTKLLPIFVKSCCADFSLDLNGEVTDPICINDKNGTILGKGIAGNPPYKFSITGNNFQTVPIFYDLGAGYYTLYIQDRKGCRDSIVLSVIDPLPLFVDAGPNKTIELGGSTVLEGSYTPHEYDITHIWTPNYNLSDSSEFMPDANPYWTTKYTLTAIQDGTGCAATNEMTVFVTKDRKLRIPNVFTPNGDGKNDFFTAYNIKAAIKIEKMFIFDRWGELLYEEKDINLGDEQKGWDGTFRGQKVTSGVYVYLFMIKFLDGEVIPFSGDITVLE